MSGFSPCGVCGVVPPPSAKFCAQCGAALAAHPLREPERGSAPKTERRQLTLMFCDLVGSTRLSLDVDPEDFTDAINAYRDACARVVKRWDGFISRFVGDGALIYFGYPRASEDDALRAVTAAWELSRAVANLDHLCSAGLKSRHKLELRARIGLHTGLVVVGELVGEEAHETAGVLGAAPNIAARLQALCQPGEVVVSDTTAELLPPTVLLRALDMPDRSDFGAVRPFCVVEMPSEPMSRRPLSASSFVGRQGTVQRLAQALAADTSYPVALFIGGEPGLGKSRLLRETIASTNLPPTCWIELSCSTYGRLSPLDPFRDWLRKGGSAAALWADQWDTTPYDRRRQIFAELRDNLLSAGARVALLVEDLHWADSTTVDFLGELVAMKPPGLVAVLMTSREPPATAISENLSLPFETLPRLTQGAAASLAQSIATPRALNAFEIAEIVRHADGVPLFIEQFVRAIAARDAGADGIPVTLRDALMSVLDTLGAGRAVTLCASVFGRRFSYRQLQLLLNVADTELAGVLSILVQAQVLVQSGETPEATYEFRHALLRDTAYYTLLRSERMRWHRRVAELAAAGTLMVEDAIPGVLATHQSLGGNWEKAIRYWLRAQEHAMARSAHAEALAHLRSGLDDCGNLALESDAVAKQLELELLRRLAQPLIAISGWSTPELENVYARAMQLCETAGSPEIEFELKRGLYNMHLLRGDLRTADGIAERLLSAARVAPSKDRENFLLVALRCKALPYFYRGQFSQARVYLLEVLSLHDPEHHVNHAFTYGMDPVMLAYSYLAWIESAQGKKTEAHLHSRSAIEHARRSRHVFSLCYALCFAASVAQMCGSVEHARQHAAEALWLGNRHNFQYWLAWAQAIEGWLIGHQDPSEGIVLIDNAISRYLATGSTLVRPYFEALACQTARSLGELQIAEREERLVEISRGSEVHFWRDLLHPED